MADEIRGQFEREARDILGPRNPAMSESAYLESVLAVVRHRERFESLVDKRGRNECWPWKGHLNPWGYGMARSPFAGESRSASRVAWEHHHREPAPPGAYICHTCDNPACVNPRHLYLGTAQDNARDREDRKRRNVIGERNPCAKLTEADVLAIRANSESSVLIAARLGVSRGLISQIRRRERWTHI